MLTVLLSWWEAECPTDCCIPSPTAAMSQGLEPVRGEQAKRRTFLVQLLWKIWQFLKSYTQSYHMTFSKYLPQKVESRNSDNTLACMFLAALFTIVKR